MKMNKTKLTATTAITLLIISAFALLLNVPVQAQEYTNIQDPEGIPLPSGITPDVTITTHPGISVRPNPVGQGQLILINIWMNPPVTNARTIPNYEVTFTRPDATTDVIGPIESYSGDTTAWFEYQVNQVGEWKVRMDFPGRYYPPGNYTSGQLIGYSSYGRTFSFTDSCYYAPSSTGDITFIVQDEQVLSWPPSELPTDYWTRPISAENRDWKVIAGNWPWPDANNYDYAGPYTIGPTSSHVVWKRQDAISGLAGGILGQLSLTSRGNTPSLIYAGRCYDTISKPGVGSVATCYDLRTGEVFYEIPISEGGFTPSIISYNLRNLPPVEGAIADQGPVIRLFSIGNDFTEIDAWTGEVIMDVPGMSGAFYNDPYVLSVQNLGGGNYRLINWTTDYNVRSASFRASHGVPEDNFTHRIQSNVSFPFSSYNVADYNALIGVRTESITDDASGITMGTRIRAVDLETGQPKWEIETPVVMYSGSTRVADHGKFCFAKRDETAGQLIAWNLNDGTLAWESDLIEWPWGFGGAYSVASAYGLVYRFSYPGVTAFDWETGDKVWQFQAPAPPYETPYSSGVGSAFYAWDSGCQIVDGKMYVANSEHSQSQPYTRGYRLFCLNATTGENIWNITGSWGTPGAVADGYLTAGNSYDGYMYVFGKGKSETSVTASPKTIGKGATILIEGTVLDQSPAQPGTPCVSKSSMTTQMEYLHMQHPIDGYWHNLTITGVPVTLTALGPDGSATNIEVTTEGYYGTFGTEWTPPAEGTYKIIASFGGDDSYGSSGAATYVTVGPAPSSDVGPGEEPTHPIISTEAAIIIGVVVIAAIAIIAYVVMRKPKQ